jgi:hypothetical protein
MMDTAPQQPPRGLGDTLAKLARATHADKLVEIFIGKPFGQCDGCAERRHKLNTAFPYKTKQP